MHNGQPLAGETASSLSLMNLQPADAGDYSCEVSYTTVHGTLNDPVNILFYPNGPETIVAEIGLEGWSVDMSCGVGAESEVSGEVRLFPNPAGEQMRVELIELPPRGSLRLLDLQGQVVLVDNFQGRMVDLDLKAVPRGMYLLEVVAGGERILKKVVLQ